MKISCHIQFISIHIFPYLIPGESFIGREAKNCFICIRFGFIIFNLSSKDCRNVMSPCIARFVLKSFLFIEVNYSI